MTPNEPEKIPLWLNPKFRNIIYQIAAVVLFGLFWKRSASVAIATLIAAWTANSAWSFTDLPQMLNMAEIPNAYVTLVVTLLVGIIGNMMVGGSARGSFFKSADYRARIESAASA